jgi:hypothetical protein
MTPMYFQQKMNPFFSLSLSDPEGSDLPSVKKVIIYAGRA